MRMFAVLILLLALGLGGGCVTVTEEDRQVEHMIGGGADEGLTQVAALEPMVAEIPAAAQSLAVLKVALADIKLNAEHLKKVHGPPKNPKKWSEENSANARAASAASHTGFWVGVGGTLMTLASLAWAYIRTTGLGQLVDTFVGTGQKIRAKAANGGLSQEDAKELYAAAVKALPKKYQAQIEAALAKAKKLAALETKTTTAG